MAIKTHMKCWGLPCSFVGSTSGSLENLNFEFSLLEIEGIENEIRSILVREVLPSPLVNLTELSNDQRQTLETWMDLAAPMVSVSSVVISNFDFLR